MSSSLVAAVLVAGAAVASDFSEREISQTDAAAFLHRPGVISFLPQTLKLRDVHYFLKSGVKVWIGSCNFGPQALVPAQAGDLPGSEQVAADFAHCEAVFRRGMQQ